MPAISNKVRSLDARDRRILQIVQRDSSLPQAAIARKVGLSTAAVHERLKKLRSSGVIRRWTAQVDPAAVGAAVSAFVEVSFERSRFEAGFLARVAKLDEVLECHHVTGEFSLLLKVRVRDMESLKRLLLHDINAHEGVRQTRTAMVLSTEKEESFVATADEGEAP